MHMHMHRMKKLILSSNRQKSKIVSTITCTFPRSICLRTPSKTVGIVFFYMLINKIVINQEFAFGPVSDLRSAVMVLSHTLLLYSKTSVIRPLSKRPKVGFQDH